MYIDAADIDLSRLTDREFEELCFDLLLRLGYENLTWRQGGGDSGRDIEGYWIVSNPLLDAYREHWFVECKHHAGGVSVEDLVTKVAWADAERPDHLLFIVSSHVTNAARTWLDRLRAQKAYKIHVLEGKLLIERILRFQDLVERYCLDKFSKLLTEAMRRWLVHDVLPDIETLALLAEHLDPGRLQPAEAAFLWAAAIWRHDEHEGWCGEHQPFSFDYLFAPLRAAAREQRSVLSARRWRDALAVVSQRNEWSSTYNREIGARLRSADGGALLYGFVQDRENEGVEFLLEGNSGFDVHIRHIPSDAAAASSAAVSRLADAMRPNSTMQRTRE